jgi:hypothetical protein
MKIRIHDEAVELSMNPGKTNDPPSALIGQNVRLWSIASVMLSNAGND